MSSIKFYNTSGLLEEIENHKQHMLSRGMKKKAKKCSEKCFLLDLSICVPLNFQSLLVWSHL